MSYNKINEPKMGPSNKLSLTFGMWCSSLCQTEIYEQQSAHSTKENKTEKEESISMHLVQAPCILYHHH